MELALYRDNEAFWFGKLTFLNHATIVENIIKKYFIDEEIAKRALKYKKVCVPP